MSNWEIIMELRVREAELLELLAEALEQLEDPFMYAPVEHNRLEEKIRDALEKENNETNHTG